jgi:hypothetical protein
MSALEVWHRTEVGDLGRQSPACAGHSASGVGGSHSRVSGDPDWSHLRRLRQHRRQRWRLRLARNSPAAGARPGPWCARARPRKKTVSSVGSAECCQARAALGQAKGPDPPSGRLSQAKGSPVHRGGWGGHVPPNATPHSPNPLSCFGSDHGFLTHTFPHLGLHPQSCRPRRACARAGLPSGSHASVSGLGRWVDSTMIADGGPLRQLLHSIYVRGSNSRQVSK